MDFSSSSDGKESVCSAEDLVWSLSRKNPLEKGMATHSSILAWRIPWTEKPGGLVHGVAKSNMTEQLTLSLYTFYNILYVLIHYSHHKVID